MTSWELGGELQDLDKLVATVIGGTVDDREEIDGEPEPCSPNDPLDRGHCGIDVSGFIGREGGVRGAGPFCQMTQR